MYNESKSLIIRMIHEEEYPLMETFLYEALHVPPQHERFVFETIFQPEIYMYIENFGKEDDLCFVAELDSTVVGMAFSRILCQNELKGYGNIDEFTPELAISVLPDFRNKGIGTKLLNVLHNALCERGYFGISLSVQKTNHAYSLYERLGYKVIKESQTDFVMLKTLF